MKPIVATLLLAASVAAHAADLTPQQRYQQQRQECLSGQSSQDRSTCLREAGAALAEARRGTLSSGSEADWQRNAEARCARHEDPQARDACERIARGEGTHDGSVEQGGILYELVTRSVGPEPGAEPLR